MLRLERIRFDHFDWATVDARPDRLVCQCREWVQFVAATQQAGPVVAEVRDGNSCVGVFTGLLVRKLGVTLLGSPLPGWTTPYMGFTLDPDVPRREAVAALVRFAFDDLGCHYLEFRDRYVDEKSVADLRLEVIPRLTFEVDLARDEDAVFAGMTSACRRAIRKAEKVGVTVEEASDAEFADEYYDQLRDVFAKQGLVPTYDVNRVRELVAALQPSGRILLLRARDPEGNSIATGIFPAMNTTMFFWGGASYRSAQVNRPNEAIMWHAMRYWKSRGVTVLDTGGGGEYKRKYGVREVHVPSFALSRAPALRVLRNVAARSVELRQRALGKLLTLAR